MGFNFFTIETVTARLFNNSVGTYPVARPIGNGQTSIDVKESFAWTLQRGIATEEVPAIMLTEFTPQAGSWINSLSRLADTVEAFSSGGSDPYQKLYTGEQTGFSYNLPYLVQDGSIRGSGRSNSWSAAGASAGLQGLTNIASSVASSAGNAMAGGSLSPGTMEFLKGGLQMAGESAMFAGGMGGQGFGSESIQTFGESTAPSVTISFPLYNTGTLEDANNNFSFISLFAFQNCKTRTSFLTFIPPKIYQVETDGDGGIYFPAAYVSDFTVKGIGPVRKLYDFGASSNASYGSSSRLVPEAYQISITLTSLLPESSNIMEGSLGNNKVKVISQGSTRSATESTTVLARELAKQIPGAK